LPSAINDPQISGSGGGLRAAFACTLHASGRRFDDTRLAAARLREAAAQAFHQINDFGFARFGRGLQLKMLACDLGLDDPHQGFPIFVGVLRGILFGGEAVDQRLRHVELRVADAGFTSQIELPSVDRERGA